MARQKPIEEIAAPLVGTGRGCAIVDTGHRRDVDLAVEVPVASRRLVAGG
jgi:ATP-dependent Lhr-like helicase